MIHDFLQPRPQALDLPRDAVVVVGSGAAGIAVALHLADRGHRVVLLESGGDVRDRTAIDASAHLNEGTVEQQPFDGLERGRARVLGGTTQLWDGQCMRLYETDVARRPWIPRSGWPIGLADLDSGYAQAERWLDVSGRGYGEERWAEFPGLPPLAWNPDHLRHAFTEYARRPYLGTAHRERMRRHRNLWVVTSATVSRVAVRDGRPRGVEIVAVEGRRARIDARTVVLAAGTIENTRLLQLSDPAGIGLGTGREHTGRYLQDHPVIRTAEISAPGYRFLQDRYVGLCRHGRRLFPKVRLSPAAQEEHRLLNAAAVFEHHHERAAVDAARKVAQTVRARNWTAGTLADVARASGAAPALVRALYRRSVKGLSSAGGRPSHVWLQVWVEQAPKPERRIALAESRDRLGLRQAAVSWTCDADELAASRHLTRWIAEDLHRLGVARLRELPAMTDDAAWRGTVHDGYHPAGTTRMAADPHDGVVDTDLQVHGLHGLYVVGGSVFPTSGYANPTLTIVALAFRLAGHLDRLLR